MKSIFTIRRKVLLLGFSIILVAVIISRIFDFYFISSNSKKQIQAFEKQIFKQYQQDLENVTNVAFSSLKATFKKSKSPKYLRQQVESNLRSNLNIAFQIIRNSYEKANQAEDREVALAKAKKEVQAKIQKLRFGKLGTDYIWIHSYDPKSLSNPKMIMHPLTPQLKGKELNDYKYSKGIKKDQIVYAKGMSGEAPLFALMNKTVKERGEGVVQYDWPKPTKQGLTKYQPKISYVKLFKEWGWVIGTGAYISNLEKKMQDEAANLISQFRYGKEKKDYFWIHKYNPSDLQSAEMIVHPALQGKTIKNIRFPSGEKKGKLVIGDDLKGNKAPMVETMNIVIQKKGEGFFQYYWPKYGASHYEVKISYVKLFKEWGWVIGTGIYLDEIKKKIKEKKLELQKKAQDMIWASFGIAILTLLIAFLPTYWVSSWITQPITDATKALKDIASGEGDLTHRIETKANDETAEMAHWFNSFVEKLSLLMTQVRNETELMQNSSNGISDVSLSISDNTNSLTVSFEESSASLEQSSATLAQISETTTEIAKQIRDITDKTQKAETTAREN
ncbi:MAG: methyl-accepting chemotaxis protein, partial [bacterium]